MSLSPNISHAISCTSLNMYQVYYHPKKLFIIKQTIRNKANYLQPNRLFTIKQTIHNQTDYSQSSKLFTIKQTIHNQANCSQSSNLFTIKQIIHILFQLTRTYHLNVSLNNSLPNSTFFFHLVVTLTGRTNGSGRTNDSSRCNRCYARSAVIQR